MKQMTGMLLAVGVLAAGAARAQDADDPMRSDLRCLLGMSVLAKDAQHRDAAALGSFYFTGRIQGRAPDFDINHGLRGQIQAMRASDYLAEARRCGEILSAETEAMKARGASLRPRGIGR